MGKLPSRIYELSKEILMKSISYPTVLGEAYRDLVEYYAETLSKYGVHVTIHRVPDEYVKKHLPPEYNPDKPRYILLARTGEGDKVLQFNGHYDVVSPGEGWSITEPFKPVIKDDRIYGRGASDMKGGIAAFLAAMIYLADKNPSIVIEAAIVPDEEIGGITGTGYLVNVMGSKPDWVVIAEPSGIDNIWHGHKGLVWAEIIVKGVQAHGSTPWLGINAFEKMVYIAKHFIEKYIPKLKERKSKYQYDLPGGEYPTLTLGGRLRAPGSINIVPGQVAFSMDRRLIVEENTEQVIRELEDVLNEAKKKYNAEAVLRIIEKMEPALTSPDSQLVRTLAEVIEKNTMVKPRVTVCVGGLDLRYYAYKNIQVVAYGPGSPKQAHKVDEYIELADLYKSVDIYVDLVRELSGGEI